ncbi:MAG: hypothetical protein MI725_01090 [Pirellulales bacterium]|nr:hypothetical protein [Pirellulales bacterium]
MRNPGRHTLLLTVLFVIQVSSADRGLFADDQRKPSSNNEPLKTEEVVEMILNPSTSPDSRLTSYQTLYAWPKDVRKKAFIQILELANEEYAAMAAQALIRSYPEDSVMLADRLLIRVPKMSDEHQAIVLSAIASLQDGQNNYFGFAREILAQGISKSDPSTGTDSTGILPAALAFEILAQSKTTSDQVSIQNFVRENPGIAPLWWTLASSGIGSHSIRSLTEKVYSDEQLPVNTRVAAAASVAAHEQKALKFAVEKVEAFVNKYASFDATQVRSSLEMRKTYQEIRSQADILKAFYILPGKRIKELAFTTAKSRNLLFRVHVLPAVAMRWPVEFLDAAQSTPHFSESSSLGTVVFFHPILEERVKREFPDADYDHFLNAVKQHGPKLISPLVTVMATGNN